MLGQELDALLEKQPKHMDGEGGNHFPPSTSIVHRLLGQWDGEVHCGGQFRHKQRCPVHKEHAELPHARAPETLLHAFSTTGLQFDFSNVVQRIIIAITVV